MNKNSKTKYIPIRLVVVTFRNYIDILTVVVFLFTSLYAKVEPVAGNDPYCVSMNGIEGCNACNVFIGYDWEAEIYFGLGQCVGCTAGRYYNHGLGGDGYSVYWRYNANSPVEVTNWPRGEC